MSAASRGIGRRRLHREAGTAAAGGAGIGVLDHELGALQVFLVVDFCAQQVLVAHGVDQQRHAILGHGGVVFVGDFIEGETVLETRAATALHKDTQLQVGIAFFGNQIRHLGSCAVGEDDGGRHFGDGVFGNGAHGDTPMVLNWPEWYSKGLGNCRCRRL